MKLNKIQNQFNGIIIRFFTRSNANKIEEENHASDIGI